MCTKNGGDLFTGWCTFADVDRYTCEQRCRMEQKNIIVIGSSAGGVDALQRLCAALPADLPAAVFIAQHVAPSARSVLPQILNKVSPLNVLAPVDGQQIEHGHIYVGAPDHHILVRPDRIL